MQNQSVEMFFYQARKLSNDAHEQILLCLEGDHWTEDDEKIHDLRVIFRQLLSIHEFYEPLLRLKTNKKIKNNYQLLLRSLGPRRKADVFTKLFHEFEVYWKESGKTIGKEGENDKILHSVLKNTRRKKELYEDMFQFRMLLYRTVSWYYFDSQSMVKEKKGSIEDPRNDFIVKRFDHLLKKHKKLEKQAHSGEDEKIHELRLEGKIIYYNLILCKSLLHPEGMKEAERLKKLHDVTGKLHDLEEISMVLRKKRKNADNQAYLEAMLRFFESEKEKYFIKFLKIRQK
ncbi:CHAD domain-containing protein [Proteiniclasticum ruminis]|nr:CHAD domain-containing protein [Proteiniclasticum ruminis]